MGNREQNCLSKATKLEMAERLLLSCWEIETVPESLGSI